MNNAAGYLDCVEHRGVRCMGGGRDRVVSLEDMELVNSRAENGELWVLGLAGHCASEYMPVAYPQMMDWLATKLHAETD